MRKMMLAVLILAGVCTLAGKEEEDPLRMKAASGDVSAQFRLANEYFTGTEHRRQNYTLAAHWFLRVAEKGYPEAMFNYAICLDQGLGVEPDPYKAAEYYAKAAEKGKIPQAVFNHAQVLRFGVRPRNKREEQKKPAGYTFTPDEKTALFLLESLAKDGFAPAQAELAEILIRNKPIPARDAPKIWDYLSRAAKSPEAPAKTFRMLADCYYGGIGTVPDGEQMIVNLRKACEKGDAEAMVKLAHCLEHGINTAPDPKEARLLYRRAAEQGLAAGMLKFAEAIEQGYEKDFTMKDAMEWYRRAAMMNHPQAFFRLAELADTGFPGNPPDPRASAELYLQAAKLGHARAQYRLGCLYLQENGVLARDPGAAFFWFKEGASRGDTPSMRELAQCYFKGLGCTVNRSEGIRWLRQAAADGDILAEEELNRFGN